MQGPRGDACTLYSSYTAKTANGPRRQFGPRRSSERFKCYHRVIGPTRPYGNTSRTLLASWGRTGYVAHGHFCCIRCYTTYYTRIASRPLRSYTAIQRYTLYSYTSLYTIQAIQHPSGCTSHSASKDAGGLRRDGTQRLHTRPRPPPTHTHTHTHTRSCAAHGAASVPPRLHEHHGLALALLHASAL